MNFKKHTKDMVMSGVGLGIGSSVLGGMGQGDIATKIATPGANMLGVASTAGYGMGIMKMTNNFMKNKRPVKVHSGKHVGYGFF
jgi:hypothetical protein